LWDTLKPVKLKNEQSLICKAFATWQSAYSWLSGMFHPSPVCEASFF